MGNGLENLKEALNGKGKKENYFQWFDRIADILFNEVALVSDGNKNYRLGEIEFYYYSDAHKDVFCKQDPPQLSNGCWFIHGAGIDITFGNKEKKAYGGILIRALIDDDGEVIDGSYRLLNHLALPIDKASIIDHPLKQRSEFYRSPRVGLIKKYNQNMANANAQEFIMMPYRYTVKNVINNSKYENRNYKKTFIEVWNKQSTWNASARQNPYVVIYEKWVDQYGDKVRKILANK